jgi:hypothetical protein
MTDFVEPLDLLIIDHPDDRIVDRRDDKRIYVSLPGRFSFGDSANSRGDPRLFACRAVNISVHGIAVAAPVTAKVGGRVTANIEQLGRVRGPIARVFELGFAMHIEASNQEREMLADKIDWIERNKDFEISDNRAHVRFIPRRPLSFLTLADGSVVPCFVVDISISGAAISADIMPKIGSVLAVGKVIGRVVRYIVGGFAVQFIQVQDRQEVEALVIRR